MTSPAVRRARCLYKAAAISNFIVTIPAFLVYRWYVDLFLPHRPNYRFLVWIWSGMAFLWGVSFLQISRDPEAAYPLVKYSWLEKSVTSASAIAAYSIGEVPSRFLAGVFITDVMWIPAFVWAQIELDREMRTASEGSADVHDR